jgi:hypothetical protein
MQTTVRRRPSAEREAPAFARISATGDGTDVAYHERRLRTFFRRRSGTTTEVPLEPLVFSWLAGRGTRTTRLDPHDTNSVADFQVRLATLVNDQDLFVERLIAL